MYEPFNSHGGKSRQYLRGYVIFSCFHITKSICLHVFSAHFTPQNGVMVNGPFVFDMVKLCKASGLFIYTVPRAPPTNVQGYSNSSTVIVVGWEPPIPELLRGILRGYMVLYRPANSSAGGRVDRVEPTQTLHQLIGLQPFTNYSIQVAAVTIDEGPFSSPVYVTTQPTPVENSKEPVGRNLPY